MVEFVINKYLCLRLENSKTNIYVKDKLFDQCKYLLINIQFSNNPTYESLQSIDEVEESSDQIFTDLKTTNINPEVEFWAHCSNLQVWYENDYNTNLLHRTLAFPLLKKLTDAGDRIAKKVFKEEIALRVDSGHLTTVQFLLFNGYLDYLTREETECLLNQPKSMLAQNLIRDFNRFCQEPLKNYVKIANHLEIITLIMLKYEVDYFIHIFNDLNDCVKEIFLEKTLLYLNYNNLEKHKFSHDRFYFVYERLINTIYHRFPGLYKKIRFLRAGYKNDLISLDGYLSHGA